MAKRVSTTYGDALFDLAVEEEKIDSLYREVVQVRQVFQEHPELMKVLHHPKVIKEEKLSFVENIFRNRISDELLGFLCIVIRKDRYGELDRTFDHFISRVKEHKGIGIAQVTSAQPLTSWQKRRLLNRLLETTHYSTFEMEYLVDGSVLGGLIIRIGDRVMDSSLKTQLGKLSRQLSDIRVS